MNSRDLPGIFCPSHGLSPARTRCRWCGFDPIKQNLRASGGLVPGRFLPDGPGISFPVGLQNDAYQVAGDVVE